MASLDKLDQVIQAQVKKLMAQACTELAQAYASAIAGTAPVDSGLLAGTVSAEGGKVSLQYYWYYVAYGHKVYAKHGTPVAIKRVAADGSVTAATYTRPNDFMEKAWASPQVQKVLQKYSRKFVTIPYPLKKVNMQRQDQ